MGVIVIVVEFVELVEFDVELVEFEEVEFDVEFVNETEEFPEIVTAEF
jgi:hypothetical protein